MKENDAILYLLIGLPRSGKSTWTEENKEKLDAVVVSNDWIRENILHAPNSKSTEPIIWTIADSAMRIMLSQGQNVIYDGVNHTSFVRKFFIDMAEECGAKIVPVHVNTSLDVCLERNRTNKKLPDSVLIRMASEAEGMNFNEYDRCETIMIIKRLGEQG